MKLTRFFGSLRQKLLIILILVAALPVIVTASVNILATLGLLENEIQARHGEVTEIATTQINSFVEDIQAELLLLGRSAFALELDHDQLDTFLLTYQTGVEDTVHSVYRSLWVMDAEGNELARVNSGEIVRQGDLVSHRENEVFFRPQRGEVYFSSVRIVEGEPQISVALPIYQDEVFIGVAAAIIDLEQPWEDIRQLQVGEAGYAMLIDRRGNLIVHRDETVLSRRWNLATLPPVAPALRGESQVKVYEYNSPIGGEVIGSAALIDGPNWILVVERPASEALAGEGQARQNTLIVVSVSILLALLISFWIARQITRPIVALQNATEKISAGNLAERVQVQSQDEIGQLGKSFNQMADQLSNLLSTLEERIDVRTRDLKIAADVARQVAQTLNLDSLLADVVELTRQSFNLYHVSVFLYDAHSDEMRLRSATGELGQLMLKQGRLFKLEGAKGAVPVAGRSRQPMLLNDVTQSDQYFPHPLLTATRSELALPMLIATQEGAQLIGVLDVMSEQINHFSDDDVKVLITLSEQVAVAVRNTDLYAQAEAARLAAEKASNVKSQFLASISHELRTPLNAILNFSQFVSTGMAGEINSEQAEFLDNVVNSGKHLLNLINDVLDISSIESGSLKLYVEDTVNMPEEVQTVAKSARALLADKTVELVVNVEDNLPQIVGDKRRLRQILLNLVSNACKFTDEGQVRMELRREGNQLIFAVHDTGPGIAESDQQLVFETFRQTDVGIRKGGGTGLGLPISRRLAEVHGGSLWLESTPGKGASFFVALPVRAEHLVPQIRQKKG